MAPVRRLVLDVLKPHDPPLVEFTAHLSETDTVAEATTTLVELDREVQNVSVAVEGSSVEYDAVEAAIEGLGGTVHSVDAVTCRAEETGGPHDGETEER